SRRPTAPPGRRSASFRWRRRRSTARTCSSPAASTGSRTARRTAHGRVRRRWSPIARPPRNVPRAGADERRRAARSGRLAAGRRRPDGGPGKLRKQVLAVAVQLLAARKGPFEQQAEVVQDAFHDLALPDAVELDLAVEPVL